MAADPGEHGEAARLRSLGTQEEGVGLTRRGRTKVSLLEHLYLVLSIFIYALSLSPALFLGVGFYQQFVDNGYWLLMVFGVCLMAVFGLYLSIATLLLLCAAVIRLVPAIEAGIHPLERRGSVMRWMLKAGVHNLVRTPGLSPMILSIAVLRRLYFWAFQAKVHPSAMISYNVVILDPYLLEVGPEAKIGDFTVLTGHLQDQRGFILKPVVVQEGAMIGGGCLIAPGVRIGQEAMLGGASALGVDVIIGPQELWYGAPARFVRRVGG